MGASFRLRLRPIAPRRYSCYRKEGVWGSYKTHPLQGWDTWTPPLVPKAKLVVYSSVGEPVLKRRLPEVRVFGAWTEPSVTGTACLSRDTEKPRSSERGVVTIGV